MSNSWILTAIAGGVIICAVLAAYGFKGRVSTIGVDLGTTFSVVGLRIDGEIKIVTDKLGRTIFPSVVSYLPNGQVEVGYGATQFLSERPTDTIFNAKRFIGRSLEEDSVRQYANAHPFKLVHVGTDITPYGKIGMQLSPAATGHPVVMSPESVGTRVLQHLLQITADYLGHKQVNKAVIAVPAKFTTEQRAATGSAYKAAGLKVVRVIEEPTAAAVAYQLHKKSNVRHILVYDFGGGTLDVSILYVRQGSVEVYATDGDEALGGSDLDLCLVDIIHGKIAAFASHDEGHRSDVVVSAQDECSIPSIRIKAEEVKIRLSRDELVQVSCYKHLSTLSLDSPVLESSRVAPSPRHVQIHFNVSRDEFQTQCQSFFGRAMQPVQRLLTELGMAPTDIDEVVLVGGSTRIPHVKERLRAFFGPGVNLNDHIDPDVTVAYGAASIVD